MKILLFIFLSFLCFRGIADDEKNSSYNSRIIINIIKNEKEINYYLNDVKYQKEVFIKKLNSLKKIKANSISVFLSKNLPVKLVCEIIKEFKHVNIITVDIYFTENISFKTKGFKIEKANQSGPFLRIYLKQFKK